MRSTYPSWARAISVATTSSLCFVSVKVGVLFFISTHHDDGTHGTSQDRIAVLLRIHRRVCLTISWRRDIAPSFSSSYHHTVTPTPSKLPSPSSSRCQAVAVLHVPLRHHPPCRRHAITPPPLSSRAITIVLAPLCHRYCLGPHVVAHPRHRHHCHVALALALAIVLVPSRKCPHSRLHVLASSSSCHCTAATAVISTLPSSLSCPCPPPCPHAIAPLSSSAPSHEHPSSRCRCRHCHHPCPA